DAAVQGRRQQGALPAQAVTYDADALAVHLGHRLQEVNAADIIPDGLQGTAGVGPGIFVEIVGVFSVRRVIGNEADVAAPGQLVRVAQGVAAAQARRLVLARRRVVVQAEHGGSALPD